ncbi:hypothetical protein M569_11416, partial [Genlisea aurea]
EEQIDLDLESLSFSKRLLRNMSRKLKRKDGAAAINKIEDETSRNPSRCLPIYTRGGGCSKVGAETAEDNAGGDPSYSRRSIAAVPEDYINVCGNDDSVSAIDCFPHGKLFRRHHNRRALTYSIVPDSNSINCRLPDDVLEMCLVRLPLASVMNARLVCRKWRSLCSSPRFSQIRREGSFQTPWLFLLGIVTDGYCSGEIHVFDVALDRWHRIESPVLKGRFLFSVSGIHDDVYIVGGCSSLSNTGRVDRSSFKTHKSVVVFSPSTKSWRKAASMKYARSSPVVAAAQVSHDFFAIRNQQNHHHHHRSFYRPAKLAAGASSDVYEDPHRLSVRRQQRYSLDENEFALFPPIRPWKQHESLESSRRFVVIVVGGLGPWDEPLDSGEIYDPVSNKWTEIPRLPLDFGRACSGAVCHGVLYVYSESDKLMGYDIERGTWTRIQTTPTGPPPQRVQEYYPRLVACNNERLFMVSVLWCEGEGEIGRRNKAVRKVWELDPTRVGWTETCTHPDAPMDWNAGFVADREVIFGVEIFKIFGRVLDFVTVLDVGGGGGGGGGRWKHVWRKQHEFDASSCITKSLVVLHL